MQFEVRMTGNRFLFHVHSHVCPSVHKSNAFSCWSFYCTHLFQFVFYLRCPLFSVQCMYHVQIVVSKTILVKTQNYPLPIENSILFKKSSRKILNEISCDCSKFWSENKIEYSRRIVCNPSPIEDGLARFKLVDYIGTQAKVKHTLKPSLTHTQIIKREKERRCDQKKRDGKFSWCNTSVLGSHTNTRN